jgi:hypothetical protein
MANLGCSALQRELCWWVQGISTRGREVAISPYADIRGDLLPSEGSLSDRTDSGKRAPSSISLVPALVVFAISVSSIGSLIVSTSSPPRLFLGQVGK